MKIIFDILWKKKSSNEVHRVHTVVSPLTENMQDTLLTHIPNTDSLYSSSLTGNMTLTLPHLVLL